MWTHEDACALTHNTDEAAAKLLEIGQLKQLYLPDFSSAEVILAILFLFDFPVKALPLTYCVAK